MGLEPAASGSKAIVPYPYRVPLVTILVVVTDSVLSGIEAGYQFDSQVELLTVTVAKWLKRSRCDCLSWGAGVRSPAPAV